MHLLRGALCVEQELDDMYCEKLEAPKQYITQKKASVVKEAKPRLEASEVLSGYMQKLTG